MKIKTATKHLLDSRHKKPVVKTPTLSSKKASKPLAFSTPLVKNVKTTMAPIAYKSTKKSTIK